MTPATEQENQEREPQVETSPEAVEHTPETAGQEIRQEDEKLTGDVARETQELSEMGVDMEEQREEVEELVESREKQSEESMEIIEEAKQMFKQYEKSGHAEMVENATKLFMAAMEFGTTNDDERREELRQKIGEIKAEGEVIAARMRESDAGDVEAKVKEVTKEGASEEGLDLDLSELGEIDSEFDLTAEEPAPKPKIDVPPPPESIMNAPSAFEGVGEQKPAEAMPEEGVDIDLSELDETDSPKPKIDVPPPPESIMNAPSALEAIKAAEQKKAEQEEQARKERVAQELAAQQVEEFEREQEFDRLVDEVASARTELGLETGTDVAAELAETNRQIEDLRERSENAPPRPDILLDSTELMRLQKSEQEASERITELEGKYGQADPETRKALEREMESLNSELESVRSAKSELLERHGDDVESFSDKAREVADIVETLDSKRGRLSEIETLRQSGEMSERDYDSEKEYLTEGISSLEDSLESISDKHHGEPAVDAERAGQIRSEVAGLRRKMRELETASPSDYAGGQREIDSLREDYREQVEKKMGELHGDPETQQKMAELRGRQSKLEHLQEAEARVAEGIAEGLDDERIDEMVETLEPTAEDKSVDVDLSEMEEPEEIEITEDMMEPVTEEDEALVREGLIQEVRLEEKPVEAAAATAAAVEAMRESEENLETYAESEEDDEDDEEKKPEDDKNKVPNLLAKSGSKKSKYDPNYVRGGPGKEHKSFFSKISENWKEFVSKVKSGKFW